MKDTDTCQHKRIGVIVPTEGGEDFSSWMIIGPPVLGCLDCGKAVYLECVNRNLLQLSLSVRELPDGG